MIQRATNRLLGAWQRISNRFVEKRVKQVISERQKLTRIDEFDERDIFVVGYPKSGNTWYRFLIAGAIYGIDLQLAPSALVYDLVPDLHYLPFYRRFHTPMFFKSHHLPRPEYKHVIYLIRDGRDVMVSYLHHLTAIRGEEICYFDLIRNNTLLEFGTWHEHVEAWLQNPYRASVVLTKYEDLINQPLEELHKLCEFVGVKRSDSLLQEVIEKTSFRVMRTRENESANFRENPLWPKDRNFFRRGQVGSYKDEMPSDFLAAFLEQAGPTLRRLGYLKDN